MPILILIPKFTVIIFYMEGLFTKSILITFISWWYLEFPWQIIKVFKLALISLIQSFSILEILKTFFAPWKKTFDSVGGKSIAEKFNALMDNFISRGVGATVRTFLIITALLLVVVYFILLIVVLIIWLVGPILPIIFLMQGIAKLNG
jgi:hypothetical protein